MNTADTLISLIFVFIKSREKGLITKEHIVTHTYLNLGFTLQLISNKAF